MRHRRRQFQAFLAEVEKSGRYSKARLQAPECGGNIAIISGEVSSHQDRDDIVEMARQHGFLLLAQELFIPCEPED